MSFHVTSGLELNTILHCRNNSTSSDDYLLFVQLHKVLFVIDLFLDNDSFIIIYHISLVNVQTNYCNNNLLILDVKQLKKIMKLYFFYTLKALWDGQGKMKMYYGMFRVKNQLSGKRSILHLLVSLFAMFSLVKVLYF